MRLTKCPRCELNYILDGGNLCTVCRKEVRGENEQDEIAELCSECGENPVMPGTELCASCMKEMTRHMVSDSDDELVQPGDATLPIDSVSTMDEIAIDLGDDMDAEAFGGEAFKDEDDLDEDSDEHPEKDRKAHPTEDDDPLLDDLPDGLDDLEDEEDEEDGDDDDDLRDR